MIGKSGSSAVDRFLSRLVLLGLVIIGVIWAIHWAMSWILPVLPWLFGVAVLVIAGGVVFRLRRRDW